MTTSRPSTEAGRMLDEERRHHNDAYRREFTGLRHDNWLTFRDSVTPAHLPGGTIGGLKGRRAHEILLGEGLAGKSVLDYACGLGKWSVHLAQSGADVSGFDVSDVAIELARERAAFNDLAIRFDVADAASLPYEDASFDLVVGIEALHHTIKYDGAAAELLRVLRPGGVAVFTENLGENPLLQLGRRWTMKHDAGDVFLTRKRIRRWAEGFSSVEIEPLSLFYMAKRLISQRRVLAAAYRADTFLLRAFPVLSGLCGECVIRLVR